MKSLIVAVLLSLLFIGCTDNIVNPVVRELEENEIMVYMAQAVIVESDYTDSGLNKKLTNFNSGMHFLFGYRERNNNRGSVSSTHITSKPDGYYYSVPDVSQYQLGYKIVVVYTRD